MKNITSTIQIFIISLLISPSVINAQSTWQKLANFNDANAGVWMSSSPSFNYVITSDRWIYHNDNTSNEWVPFVTVPSFYNVGSIKASQVSNRVFCLTSSSGIAYTDNFGASWQSNNLNSGGGNSGFGATILAYGLNGTTVLISTIGTISGNIQNNLFVSNNNGTTFSSLPTLNFYPTGFHFLDNNQVLSNTADGVFKSTNINEAGSWTQIGLAGMEVTDIKINGTTIYASVKDNNTGKVYKSNNSGQDWMEITGLPANTNVPKIAFDATNQRLFATTTSGVFLYQNNAWSTISTINKAHEIILTANQTTLFCGIRVNGILKVDATTLAVEPINNGLIINSDLMAVSADNQMYTASSNTSFLSKLNLNNLTWTSQTLGENLDFTRNLSLATASDGQCVIGGMHFIAKTANQGTTITTIANDTTAPVAPVYNILFPQKMFLGNNGSISMIQHSVQDYIDYSPDMGATWSVLFQNISGQFPAFLNFTKVCSGLQNHYILGSSLQTAQNSIAISSNQGATWSTVPNPPSSIKDIFIDRFDKLYAVTNTAIYSFDASSQQWTPLNINLSSAASNKVVEVKFDYNNKIHVLIRSTTTPFNEEGMYVLNQDNTTFTHTPFEIQNGQTLAFKNLSFSNNNTPVAMTSLANRDFEIEGIYFFKEGAFLGQTSNEIPTLLVYPNPASTTVHIPALQNKTISAQLVTISGQTLPITITDGFFNVSQIANGFYLLKINTEEASKTIKLIIKH
jgi:hypothetical protein